MVRVPLELSDPVDVHPELTEAALEQIDPGVEAPADPLGDALGEAGEGLLHGLLEPVRHPGVVLVEVPAAGHGPVACVRDAAGAARIAAVAVRGRILLLGLRETCRPQCEQVRAQRHEPTRRQGRPPRPELVRIGSGPGGGVHRGSEPCGEPLDLAGGRAEPFGVLAQLRRVHPPEGVHRAPPATVAPAANRRACSRIGSTVPSTSPPSTGCTASSGPSG